jgi:hypothetical protein
MAKENSSVLWAWPCDLRSARLVCGYELVTEQEASTWGFCYDVPVFNSHLFPSDDTTIMYKKTMVEDLKVENV